LQFDLSAVPPDATVLSATLSLYCFEDPAPDFAVPYTIHRITTPWQDSTATWLDASATLLWTTPGGDYLQDTIQVVTFAGTSTGLWNTSDITSAVDAFVRDPSSNHGITIFAPQHSSEGTLWYSSECATDSLRPKVTVTYATASVMPGAARTVMASSPLAAQGRRSYTLDGRNAGGSHPGVALCRDGATGGQARVYRTVTVR
jgi:hypothetical protein